MSTTWWLSAVGVAFLLGIASGFFVWRKILAWALMTHLKDHDSELRKLLGLDEGEEWKRGTEYESE